MPLRPDPLPQDAAQLSRIILSLDAENADLKARVAFLEQQLFGPKSEKMTTLDPAQVTLDLGDLSEGSRIPSSGPFCAPDTCPSRPSLQ